MRDRSRVSAGYLILSLTGLAIVFAYAGIIRWPEPRYLMSAYPFIFLGAMLLLSDLMIRWKLFGTHDPIMPSKLPKSTTPDRPSGCTTITPNVSLHSSKGESLKNGPSSILGFMNSGWNEFFFLKGTGVF